MAAVDYGNNSSPTRSWPQFTIFSKVDVTVHTELSFHHKAKQMVSWDLMSLRRYQRQTDFVEYGFDKTCGISDHEWFA